jgi:hypothetical protein
MPGVFPDYPAPVIRTEIRSIEILLTLTRLLNVRWKGHNDI